MATKKPLHIVVRATNDTVHFLCGCPPAKRRYNNTGKDRISVNAGKQPTCPDCLTLWELELSFTSSSQGDNAGHLTI